MHFSVHMLHYPKAFSPQEIRLWEFWLTDYSLFEL